MIALTRIFHTDLLRKPGSQMNAALSSKSSLGSMDSYSRRQTSSLALPHQSSLPPHNDQYEICRLNTTHPIEPFAFKEWALVCEALGSGEQSLLVRKGGIAEGRGGFGFEHTEFFLFPTWFHGQIDKIRSKSASAILNTTPDILQLEYIACIEWSGFLTDRQKAAELATLHVLDETVIEERFHYCGKHQTNTSGIHVAFVRVHRLDVPVALRMENRFGGCRSWVQLPQMVVGTSVSVLSDQEHAERRHLLERILNPDISYRSTAETGKPDGCCVRLTL